MMRLLKFSMTTSDRDKPLDQFQTLLGAGVDADAALVGVGVGELAGGVGAGFHAGGHGKAVLAQGVEVQRPLDLDDLRAQGAQPAGRPRAGANPGEIDDADALQWCRQGHW